MIQRDNSAVSDTGTAVLDGYITEVELVRQLRVTRRTFHVWKAAGETPVPTYIGSRVYYSRNDINDWLLAQRREVVAS